MGTAAHQQFEHSRISFLHRHHHLDQALQQKSAVIFAISFCAPQLNSGKKRCRMTCYFWWQQHISDALDSACAAADATFEPSLLSLAKKVIIFTDSTLTMMMITIMCVHLALINCHIEHKSVIQHTRKRDTLKQSCAAFSNIRELIGDQRCCCCRFCHFN